MVSDFLIEERLAQTLSTVAEIIPESPPSSWAEAKAMRAMGLPGEGKTSVTLKNRRKSGRRLLSIGIVAGLAGAGTAAAAATGAFNSRANQVFKQFASIPEPAAWGRLPAFNPRNEILEVTNPGPEGTTVSAWTYSVTHGFECVAVVDSEAGEPTFPGKGPGVGGGCSGIPSHSAPTVTAASPQAMTYGADAGLWRSPHGNLYYLTAGKTPEGATRVVLTFANGSTRSVHVGHAWFATGIPYDLFVGGYKGVFYGASGQLLQGTLSSP